MSFVLELMQHSIEQKVFQLASNSNSRVNVKIVYKQQQNPSQRPKQIGITSNSREHTLNTDKDNTNDCYVYQHSTKRSTLLCSAKFLRRYENHHHRSLDVFACPIVSFNDFSAFAPYMQEGGRNVLQPMVHMYDSRDLIWFVSIVVMWKCCA